MLFGVTVCKHISNRSGIKAKLDARDIEFQEQCLPQIGLHQGFTKCDDGTWIELIFDPKEVTG